MNNFDINSKIIKVSGSIGMEKLVCDKKNIFIFFDDHSNNLYCRDNNSIFLYDIFDSMIKPDSNYIILLEEPFVKNYSNIKFLWNETPHIIKFRNFYKKIIKQCSDTKVCNVFPVDIRLIICDVSIDELVSNIDSDEYFSNYNISVNEYFKHLLYIFDYIDWDDKLFKDSDSNLKFLKKVYSKYTQDKYYINLKAQFDKFYNSFIKPNSNMIIRNFIKKYNLNEYNFLSGYPFENNNEDIFLDQYDKLINGLMELYIYILLSGMNYNNVIIYCGYYHSNNLAYILKKYYNYKNEYKIGHTQDIEKEEKNKHIYNCLHIDEKIFNL
jgi:hypothetical protein